jgi:hypothetical protein
MENLNQELLFEIIKQRTGIIDEEIIGCFVSNYCDINVCGRFNNNGCKKITYCQLFAKALGEYYDEQNKQG